MNANQLINSLTFAEVNSKLEGDTRRMMQNERVALQAAVSSGDSKWITEAITEAKRVAEMWGVEMRVVIDNPKPAKGYAPMSIPKNQPSASPAVKITRAEARKLSRKSGQHREPYRGSGHVLADGSFLFCDPSSGDFFLRAAKLPPFPAEQPSTSGVTRATHCPLPEVARETPLYDLTPNQIEALEAWYLDLHGIVEGDSLRSILGNGHQWSLTLGEWACGEIAVAHCPQA